MTNNQKLIEEEIAYPIYTFSMNWIQDGVHDPNYPESLMYKNQPEGRIKNGTSFSKMMKLEMTEKDLETYINNFWKTYSESDKLKNLNPVDFTYSVSVKYETWNCTWFSHETFDVGQSDQEALTSFENYVRRYEDMQSYDISEKPENYICLMGAEDRWRWTGEEGKPAPCRCEGCKDAGMIRINH